MAFVLQITTAFGLEAVVKRELYDLGYETVQVEDGHLEIKGSYEDVAKLNLWLRAADRVRIVVARFPAKSFEDLFQGVTRLPWGDLMPVTAKFPVDAKSYKSALFSLSDIQSIAKKAIVESMKKKYNTGWFEETGALFPIEVGIRRDIASVTLDTTGVSLHKRGYRTAQGAAPLKETLAAALLLLSYWNPDRTLHDPFCGSGTIPIEAAMIARNIAPGLDRSFAGQEFGDAFAREFIRVRKEALSVIDHKKRLYILGSDIDHRQVLTARDNAARIGLGDDITFFIKDIRELDLLDKYGVCITNPPYGDRLADAEEADALIRAMGSLFGALPTWSVYALSPSEEFEALYGKPSDRKRKLFNGDKKVWYYQYYGPRPPRDFDYKQRPKEAETEA